MQLLLACALLCAVHCIYGWQLLKLPETPIQKVQKAPGDPVLKVQDPYSQCRVHLVGVSHGSASSAELVSRVITAQKPSCVVLELCDERYLAMCLDSSIPPSNNSTMSVIYDKKLEAQSERGRPVLSTFAAYAEFVRQQGPVIGSFVTVGMLTSAVQRLVRSSEINDEFVTAMKTSQQLNVPIRLGDAQQSATLNSVRKVISKDTLNPVMVQESAKALLFSAFGLQADNFDPLPSPVPPRDKHAEALRRALASSDWLNLPEVYIRNRSLILSLSPLLLVSLFTVLVGYLPTWTEHAGSSAEAGANLGRSSMLIAQLQAMLAKVVAGKSVGSQAVALAKPVTGLLPALKASTAGAGLNAALPHALAATALAKLHVHLPSQLVAPLHALAAQAAHAWAVVRASLATEPPPAVSSALSAAADVVSFLLMVRLGKLIGTDRDRIIASKVQDACRAYPGTDVVVVIGMLHCNGVARWLLSGADPLVTAKAPGEQ